jgi:ABC-type uncharacterized transport system substrate-binding protein
MGLVGLNIYVYRGGEMYRIIIICLISVFMFCCTQKGEKKLYTIGFVQMTEDPLLDEAQKGVIDSLKEQGFVEGKNLHIDYQNAQGGMSNIPLILRKFISDKVDMIITNTTPCMVAAAGNVKVDCSIYSSFQSGTTKNEKTLKPHRSL